MTIASKDNSVPQKAVQNTIAEEILEALGQNGQQQYDYILKLLQDREKATIEKRDNDILEWCYKNNMIEFKNSPIRLGILDGGWVNVIKLKEFMENSK